MALLLECNCHCLFYLDLDLADLADLADLGLDLADLGLGVGLGVGLGLGLGADLADTWSVG